MAAKWNRGNARELILEALKRGLVNTGRSLNVGKETLPAISITSSARAVPLQHPIELLGKAGSDSKQKRKNQSCKFSRVERREEHAQGKQKGVVINNKRKISELNLTSVFGFESQMEPSDAQAFSAFDQKVKDFEKQSEAMNEEEKWYAMKFEGFKNLTSIT